MTLSQTTSSTICDQHYSNTRWSVILKYSEDEDEKSKTALNWLAKHYWHPVYYYILYHCRDANRAEDLTQDFFSQLIEKKTLKYVDKNRGRFRNFLKASIKNFLIQMWQKKMAQKRGGNTAIVSLHDLNDDNMPLKKDSENPERLFDLKWTEALMDRVFKRIQEDFKKSGREKHFEKYRNYLFHKGAEDYKTVSKEFGITVQNVKTSISRLRQKFVQYFHDEVSKTIVNVDEIEDEVKTLFKNF